eukprot:s1889_g7.t1
MVFFKCRERSTGRAVINGFDLSSSDGGNGDLPWRCLLHAAHSTPTNWSAGLNGLDAVYAAPVVAPRVIQVPAVQTVNSGYGTRIASVPVVPTSTASTGSTPVVPTSTTNTSSGGARRQFMNPKSFMLLYNFKGDFKINGRPMILTVDPPDSAKLATGLRIWDGGIVLAKYLEFYAPKMAQRLQRSVICHTMS